MIANKYNSNSNADGSTSDRSIISKKMIGESSNRLHETKINNFKNDLLLNSKKD